MLRRWRTAIVLALVAVAAVAGQLAAVAPADAAPVHPAAVQTAAPPVVTIAVTSRFRAVTGDVFVVYDGGIASSAHIHGAITGAASGEVAALYGQIFPYHKAPVRLGTLRLKTGRNVYSFPVTPIVATRYAVRVFAGSSPTARDLATSRALNLFVIANEFFKGGEGACTTRPVCGKTAQLFTIVPERTIATEMSKRMLPYFGLALGTISEPPPPKYLILDGGHPSVTRARKVSNIEYETTVSWSFNIGNNSSYDYAWLTCVRDSEVKDGLGLPGSHECGAAKILRTIPYLGEPAK